MPFSNSNVFKNIANQEFNNRVLGNQPFGNAQMAIIELNNERPRHSASVHRLTTSLVSPDCALVNRESANRESPNQELPNRQLDNWKSFGLTDGSNDVPKCMLTPSPSINNSFVCFNIGVGDQNDSLDNNIDHFRRRGVKERGKTLLCCC